MSINELPEEWRQRLRASATARVIVRIDEESLEGAVRDTTNFATNDSAFGLWRDRTDITEVNAYLQKLRVPRDTRDQ